MTLQTLSEQEIRNLCYDYIVCDSCGSPAPRKCCSRCKTVYYCSRECQKQHWKSHKSECIPVKERLEQVEATTEDETPKEAPRITLVTEEMEKAAAFHTTRASQKGIDDATREKECQLALQEIKKVLEEDKANVPARMSQGRVLRLSGEFDRALEVYEQVWKDLTPALARYEEHQDVMERCRMAMEEQKDQEAEKLLEESQAIDAKGVLPAETFVAVKLDMAKTMMEAERWQDALDKYRDAFGFDLSKIESLQQQEVIMGSSQCLYNMKDYEKAKVLGKSAIEMNRSFPGIHKYVALSQIALQETDEAKETMANAIMYEAPWDEIHQAAMLKDWRAMFGEN